MPKFDGSMVSLPLGSLGVSSTTGSFSEQEIMKIDSIIKDRSFFILLFFSGTNLLQYRLYNKHPLVEGVFLLDSETMGLRFISKETFNSESSSVLH